MQLKHTILALAAAGMLSAQAYASEAQVQAVTQPAQPVATFTEADIGALFEQADKPMQLAALSEAEMRETEGAWVWLYMYAPQITAASLWAYNAAPRLGYTIDNFRYNYWPRISSWW